MTGATEIVNVFVIVLTPPLRVSPLSVSVTVTVELPLTFGAIVKAKLALAFVGLVPTKLPRLLDDGTLENKPGLVEVRLATVSVCPFAASKLLPTEMPVKKLVPTAPIDWLDELCWKANADWAKLIFGASFTSVYTTEEVAVACSGPPLPVLPWSLTLMVTVAVPENPART